MLLFLSSSFICAQESSIIPSHKLNISEGLQSPIRIAFDNKDIAYVTDASQKCIVKYNMSGDYIGTINPGGSPLSIAISHENNIFIGDKETGVIFKLDDSGNATEFYEETLFPSSMIFGPDNLLYVVDSEQKKVIILDREGTVVGVIGEGTLILPTGIAYDHINERIYVSEHGGIGTGFNPVAKIWVFDLQGNLIQTLGSHGNALGQFYRIQGMTIGRCGKLYVTDPFQGAISVFDNANVITRFGEYGEELGQLNSPLDVIADSHGDIWVSSMNNGSIEVFKIVEKNPSSNITCADTLICPGETTDIAIDLTGTAPWTLTYTVDGANPTTISNVTDSPYMLTVSFPGIYEILSLSDAFEMASCRTGRVGIALKNLPVPGFTFTKNLMELSFMNSSTNADSYFWDFGDNQTSEEKNPVHLYEESGTYKVILSAFNETCGVSVESNALVEMGTSVELVERDAFVKIYPNPTNGLTKIEFTTPVLSDLIIEITNIKGQAMYNKLFSAIGTIEQIDLSYLPQGIYTVRFISNEFFDTRKIVIVR